MQARGTPATAVQTLAGQFNGDTAANYGSQRMASTSNAAPASVQSIGATSMELGLMVAGSALAALPLRRRSSSPITRARRSGKASRPPQPSAAVLFCRVAIRAIRLIRRRLDAVE